MERNTFTQMFIPFPTVTMKEVVEEEEEGWTKAARSREKKSFCNSALCVAVRSLCSCNETAGCGTRLLEVI